MSIQIVKLTNTGPPGATGATGPAGPTGPQGPQGPGNPTLQLDTMAIGSDFTLDPTVFGYYIDCTAGVVTGTLPAATGSGKVYLACKIDDTDNPATIVSVGSDLIDGSTSINLAIQYSDCLLQDAASGFWHGILGT